MSKTSVQLENTELKPRIKRELRTVRAMLRIYCQSKHGRKDFLCNECSELEHYANERLLNCTFQEDKPTCGKCPIHCYRPTMRKKIVEVMKFSGPRMIVHHPFLAFQHLLDGRRTVQKFTK